MRHHTRNSRLLSLLAINFEIVTIAFPQFSVSFARIAQRFPKSLLYLKFIIVSIKSWNYAIPKSQLFIKYNCPRNFRFFSRSHYRSVIVFDSRLPPHVSRVASIFPERCEICRVLPVKSLSAVKTVAIANALSCTQVQPTWVRQLDAKEAGRIRSDVLELRCGNGPGRGLWTSWDVNGQWWAYNLNAHKALCIT